jgi:hypothetical protein
MTNCTVRLGCAAPTPHAFYRAKREEYMPWTADYFPVSMKHLSPLVRNKAIEIANALLDEDMDEGKAIRIAIAKAKEWAEQQSETG